MPASKPLAGAAGAVEREQRVEIRVGDRTAIGAAWPALDRMRRAHGSSRVARVVDGPADEHARGGSASLVRRGPRSADRSGDRHGVHRGVAVIQLVGRAREAALRRLQDALGLPDSGARTTRSTSWRARASPARARCRCVVGRVHVDFPLRIALRVAGEALRRRQPLALAADREPLQHARRRAERRSGAARPCR